MKSVTLFSTDSQYLNSKTPLNNCSSNSKLLVPTMHGSEQEKFPAMEEDEASGVNLL